MNNKKRIRIRVTDDEFKEDIYNGLLGPRETTKVIKKIKQKFM